MCCADIRGFVLKSPQLICVKQLAQQERVGTSSDSRRDAANQLQAIRSGYTACLGVFDSRSLDLLSLHPNGVDLMKLKGEPGTYTVRGWY